MAIRLSPSALALLSALLVAGSAHAEQNRPNSLDAATALRELVDAGYVNIGAKGELTVKTSVLEILKNAGVAQTVMHSGVGIVSPNSCEGGPPVESER